VRLSGAFKHLLVTEQVSNALNIRFHLYEHAGIICALIRGQNSELWSQPSKLDSIFFSGPILWNVFNMDKNEWILLALVNNAAKM